MYATQLGNVSVLETAQQLNVERTAAQVPAELAMPLQTAPAGLVSATSPAPASAVPAVATAVAGNVDLAAQLRSNATKTLELASASLIALAANVVTTCIPFAKS